MELMSLLHFFDVPPAFPWSGAMGDFGVSEREITLRTSYPKVVELIQLFLWDMLNHHFEPKVAIRSLSLRLSKPNSG
jgi:hypothetical protein